MRPQQRALTEIERVVQVHRRMVRGKVQRAEVVPLRLAFRPERHRKAELAADADDLVDAEGDGVASATPPSTRGEREVEGWPARAAAGERGAALVERGAQAGL